MGLLFTLADVTTGAFAALTTSVQEFSITVANGNTTGTDTITSVDKSLSSIFFTGQRTADSQDDFDRGMCNVVLTNGTTVTATRAIGQTDEIVAGYIVEWSSSYVKEVFHGTITMTSDTSVESSSHNATLANCAAVYCGNTTTEVADVFSSSWAHIEKSGSDTAVTVTANHRDANDTLIVSYNLIEFHAAVVNQIQEVSISMANGVGPSATATITAVDMDKTLMLNGGQEVFNTGTGVLDDSMCRGDLTNTTTITTTRVGTANDITHTMTAVEFNDAVFTSINRVENTFGDAETTDTTTLGTALTDTDSAFVSYLGSTMGTGFTGDWQANVVRSTNLITSTTTVDSVRNTASAGPLINSYEVYQA